jgi:hypothetical protein
MKPKSMFYDEKTSPPNHFWNNRGIIRWNRDDFIDNFRCKINLQTFVKIVILIILLTFLGVILLSWLSQSSHNFKSDSSQRENSSSQQQTSSSNTIVTTISSTSSPSSQIKEESIDIQKTAKFDSTSTTTTQTISSSSTSANSISNFDDYTTEKSIYNADDDAALLTKKYVRLNSLIISINLYTEDGL